MLKNIFSRVRAVLKNRKKLMRNELLLPCMEGKSYLVHNGRGFNRVEVVRLRLTKKAGEFVLTRKAPVHKKKKRK